MTVRPARCGNCGDVVTVGVDLTPLEDLLRQQTASILRAIRTEGKHITMDINQEIDAALAPVVSAVATVSADVARELKDFAAAIAPKLTDEEKSTFAGIAQNLLDLDTSVNTADPAAVATPPVDGSAAGDAPVDEPVDTTPAAAAAE